MGHRPEEPSVTHGERGRRGSMSRKETRGRTAQALEEKEDRGAVPEMNALCEVESDSNEGLFGLREMRGIGGDKSTTAFSADKEETDVGGVHMLTATGGIRPGPVYLWGRIGSCEAFIKIMIDSGNTVSDLVSEEFADQLESEGEAVSGKLEVPTAAAANTL